jgi:NADH pyrophosphatase NudC (nudix superfamily)
MAKEPRFCEQCGGALARARVDGEPDGRERLRCAACGFIRYENPTPVVAAIVEHDGHIILARNVGWPEGMYGLVTGFLERDESPEEGVLREVREELGLAGEIASLVGVYPFAQRNELIVAYHVRATGAITVGAELAGIKRVPVEKLRAWPFGTGLAVRDWLARRTPPPSTTAP